LMSSTASAPPEIYTLSLHRRSSDLLGALPEGVGTRIVIRITANVNRSSPANDAPEGPRGFGWPESRRSRPGWRGRGGGKINQTGSAAGWAPWGPRVATNPGLSRGNAIA